MFCELPYGFLFLWLLYMYINYYMYVEAGVWRIGAAELVE